jgi:hypothetical protein
LILLNPLVIDSIPARPTNPFLVRTGVSTYDAMPAACFTFALCRLERGAFEDRVFLHGRKAIVLR